MVDQEKTDRLRALWKSGKDKFSSFYAVLNEVRKEIGDEALPHYCFDELLIGISRINAVRKVLTDDDAARVKAEMEASVRKDRARREAEAHVKALQKIERENELSAKRVQNAERKAAEAKGKAERIKAEKREANRERREAKAAREGDARERAAREILADPAASRDVICQRADVSPIIATEARARLEAIGRVPPKEAVTRDNDLYDRCVNEGRVAAKSQWKLGDLAITVSGLKVYGEGTLEQYASDIGVEYKTLLDYQMVVKAWPQISGRPENWTIARDLRNHPDRFAIVVKAPHITVEEAREIMRAYRVKTNVVPLKGA